MKLGDCVIKVECAEQDVNSLSAIQSKSHTLNTGGARTIHTHYLDKDSIKRINDEDGNDDRGSLVWRTVACGFGHWSDHWRGLV